APPALARPPRWRVRRVRAVPPAGGCDPPAPLAHPRPHGRAGVAPPRGDALGTGDDLVELTPSPEARRLVRHGARDLPPTLRVRAIRYRWRGFRPQTLLT